MIHDTHVLTGAEAAPWARRPPRILLPLLVVGVVVATIAVALVRETSAADAAGLTHADVLTPWAAGISAAQGVLLVSLGLVWASPRATAWAATVSLVVLAAAPAQFPSAGLWVPASVLAAAAGGSTLLAMHQRMTASSWAAGRARTTPDVADDARRHLMRVRLLRTGTGLLLVLVGALGVVLTIADGRAAEAFRASAGTAPGSVVAVTDDELHATVELDDGTRVEVPLVATTPVVGELVEIRYAPGTARSELVEDVFDHTGALVPGVGGLVAGSVLLGGAVGRRRDLHRLVEQGGAPLRLVADWSPAHNGILLSVVDDRRPFALVRNLVPAWPGGLDEQPWYSQAFDDEEPQDGPPDDAELLAEAARLTRPEDDDRAVGLPCTSWSTAPVTVIGLTQDGRPAAVAGPDGHWYVGDDPVQVPRIADVRGRAGRDALSGGRLVTPPSPLGVYEPQEGRPLPVGERDALHRARRMADRPVRGSLRGFAARTGSWLPPLLVLPLLLLVRWLAPDLSLVRLGMLALAAVNVGSLWNHLSRAQLTIRRSGLLVTGFWLDTLVPWSMLDRVVTGPESLVLRTTDTAAGESTGGAILCPASDDALPLLGTSRDPQETRQRIELARPFVGTPSPTARTTRRPALSLLVGLVGGAAVVAGYLLG